MPRGSRLFSERTAFLIVFGIVTVVLLGASLWVLNYVFGATVEAAEEAQRTTPAYVNYLADGSYIADESNTAVQEYIVEFPEPQNAQVLVGLNTSQIWGYMTTFLSGGMQVDCTYCHVLDNFGAETLDEYIALGGDETTYNRKITARAHLEMSADLNQNWLTTLTDYPAGFGDERVGVEEPLAKQPSGSQIICATCHLGEPLPEPWEESVLHALPDDYRLPLRGPDGNVGTEDDINAALVMTGQDDLYSLDAVQYNQHTMTHFNNSLGVGCTHCHNSRYFPSWEQPAKYYGYTMLLMNQHILGEYSEEWLNGKEPSCWMCHREQVIPPGSAVSSAVVPPPLASDYSE